MTIDKMKQPIEVFEQELRKCACGGNPKLRTRKDSSSGWNLEIHCDSCGRSTGGVGNNINRVKELWETQIAPPRGDIIRMTIRYLEARDLLISIGMGLSKGTYAKRLIHKIEYWLDDDGQKRMPVYEDIAKRIINREKRQKIDKI